jgi:DNA-binding MarR family transcriptional regulator
MTSQPDGFLIGSLLSAAAAELERRVLDGYHAAGFTDIRAVHSNILRLLPPEGCRVTELAERAYSSKQAIGYLVEYLEDHGYLERVADPNDRRAQIVRRTERGWEVNRTAWRLVQQVQTEWAQQLGQERMESMIESLRMLVQLLGIPYTGSISQVSTRPRHEQRP